MPCLPANAGELQGGRKQRRCPWTDWGEGGHVESLLAWAHSAFTAPTRTSYARSQTTLGP